MGIPVSASKSSAGYARNIDGTAWIWQSHKGYCSFHHNQWGHCHSCQSYRRCCSSYSATEPVSALVSVSSSVYNLTWDAVSDPVHISFFLSVPVFTSVPVQTPVSVPVTDPWEPLIPNSVLDPVPVTDPGEQGNLV